MEIIYDKKYEDLLLLQRTGLKKYKVITNKILTDCIMKDFIRLENYITKDIKNWLDIGCGLGYINIPIFKKLNTGNIYLLDKSKIETHKRITQFGSAKDFGFYNNLEFTKEFLMLNGIPDEKINLITADSINNIDKKLDLVISLLSWGFHYPFDTYSDSVYSLLNDSGIIIIYCRSTHYQEILKDKRFTWEILNNDKEKTWMILGKKSF